MVYNLRQFLVVLTLIATFHGSKCDAEFQKYRLGRVVDNIIEEKSQIRIDNNGNKYQISYDIDCVKNFFNFPQNYKMMVGQFEEMFFVLAARTKCWDEDKAFALLENTHITISSRVKLHCVKFYLQRLEPTSKLVENFIISDYEAEECKRIFRTEDYLEIQKFFESELGPLSDYSCGALSKNAADDYFKFYCKGILIQKGDYSEDLRKAEKIKLMEYFKNVAIGTVSCAIKRFEADPEAYIANNTLNYYYKNRFENDETNSNKKLQKVEEAIDYNCVEDKLNLPKIGSQAFSVVETKILIASAKSKCIKVDDLTFSNLFIDFIMDDHDYSGRYISCSKLKLYDLEPESRLAFGASEYESERDRCDYYEIIFQTYSVPTWTYKEQVGRLNETTCGIITDNTEDLIALKTLLISSESNEEVKVIETKELFKYVTGKLQNLADCILERNRLEN